MTWQEWHASSIEFASERLKIGLLTTKPEEAGWKPEAREGSPGRDVLDMASECVNISLMFAAMFEGRQPPEHVKFSNQAEAAKAIDDSTGVLAATVRGLGDDALSREFPVPWGSATGATFLQIACMHLAYHTGQVNYVQTLYGDTVFHMQAPDA